MSMTLVRKELTKRQRLIKFCVVGVSCAIFQVMLLSWITALGAIDDVANLIAFAISAQINFFLSRHITWRDEKSNNLFGTVKELFHFNWTRGMLYIITPVVFFFANMFMHYWLASLAGNMIGLVLSYLITDRFVFTSRRKGKERIHANQIQPQIALPLRSRTDCPTRFIRSK